MKINPENLILSDLSIDSPDLAVNNPREDKGSSSPIDDINSEINSI